MFDKAPKIRRLELESHVIGMSDFPLSQLTTLKLTRVSESASDESTAVTSIQDILQQCISLEELFLDPWDFSEELVDHEKTVTLPSLASLRFGCPNNEIKYEGDCPPIETPGLLASLRVPALKSLSVHGSATTMQDAYTCIKVSKPPPITSLCVEDYPPTTVPRDLTRTFWSC